VRRDENKVNWDYCATVDGGASWCRQSSGVTDDLESVKFVDTQHGWAVAFEHGTVLRTEDGGTTWERTSVGEQSLDSVSFADTLHGWIVGQNGFIAATDDGGRSWYRQAISSPMFEFAWLLATQFVDLDRGWAVGRAILATSDGGRTWVDTQADNTDSDNRELLFFRFLNSAFFVDSKHGWIAADGGLIFVTGDGGASWRLQHTPSDNNLNSIYFADLKHGWAVGDMGAILWTNNGGAKWAIQRYETAGLTVDLRSVSCPDNFSCWSVGTGETILSTKDGGDTWSVQR
jgi:photosystem II stability/assembly factor-like uncharacterized protein